MLLEKSRRNRVERPKQCPKCNERRVTKNGIVIGKQRWRCKGCGYNFTRMSPRGVHPGLKALAILLYSAGKSSYGMISRLLGVSNVAVYKWIREEARRIGDPELPSEVKAIEIDEMWHFIGSKKTKHGSSRP